MLMDVGQPCKPIGLGKRRLGLAMEEGQIEDLGNMMKWNATYAKVKFVKYWSCNNKLQLVKTCNLYLSFMIFYA